MKQESALLLPSIAAAYRITPDLDVGVRLTAGNLKSNDQVVVWGTPGNVEEDVKKDALFTADVKDAFIPALGLGATYRIGPNDRARRATGRRRSSIKAKGTAVSAARPRQRSRSRVIGPVPDDEAMLRDGRHDARAEGVHLAPAADDRDDRRSLQDPRRRATR